ncbi:OBAP family protein [Pseudomonas entomophila]|uniref:OBAP family protein n=1 Tax=Pseudomonas entomophila TaxID=312306 RepID=UPI0015E34A0A|nr:OBAP family protein [Pseudomonas entomophila]MBA1188042.1 OBAP family protein [Pseudomonas entomophila]
MPIARPSNRTVIASLGLLCLALQGCAGRDTASPVDVPGAPKQADTRALELGAQTLQSQAPIDQLNTYLDGFHFYNGHPHVQMEAHHYCAIVNEELIQCVIYDGNQRDARLMGVEYIISKRLFAQLPAKEKALWHSHAHEVTSGQLIAPGVPLAAETRLMAKLADTYGKTWHTWHTDQDKALPLGVPQLMMGFTADGQADAEMVRQRDLRMQVDTQEHRQARAKIRPAPVERGADAWQNGNVVQIPDPTGHDHVKPRPATSLDENARSDGGR